MSMVSRDPRLADVEVRFRHDDGDEVTCGLDRLPVDDVLAGRPIRDFRWFKGRRFYQPDIQPLRTARARLPVLDPTDVPTAVVAAGGSDADQQSPRGGR